MIEAISTDGLYDSTYSNIINEFQSLRAKQIKHNFAINMLGTTSLFYSIIDSIFTPFKRNRKLSRYANFVTRRTLRYISKVRKIPTSYAGVIWTKDVVGSSTLPYPVRRIEYPWAILNAALDKPMKILDIGSGVSVFPIYLASKGHEVFSIDNDEILMNRISPRLAKWCSATVKYSADDITKLEFEDNTFDRVFCISVIEHLEEEIVDGKPVNFHKYNLDIKAIGEMLRVLKPNGVLILTFEWSENTEDLRSYKLDDIYERVLNPYRRYLIKDEKPKINWNELKEKHVKAWKSFPPYNYVTEGWAIGVVLQKK